MKYIKTLGFILLSLVCTIQACNQSDNCSFEENLRLRHKGADMPLWVRGNMGSGKILIFLHGGPGECALCLRDYFVDIEKEIAVVYWDQRIAGSAAGNANPATLNYPQFAEDLEMVVRLLKKQYPEHELYLLGHSFGVEVVWQFLTTGNLQQLVKACIALDGSYSTYDWLVQVRAWVMREAAAQGDTEALSYMQTQFISADSMSHVDWGAWYSRMFRLGANPTWPSDDKGYDFNLWFKSPHSQFSQVNNTGQYDNYYTREIFRYDRRGLLKNITIPVALFWGAKDGIIPIELGYQTRQLFERPVDFVRFENSWHSAFHTENEKFSKSLLDFVKMH